MIISYTLLDLNYLGLECDIAIEKLTFVSFVNSNVVKMFCNALMITFFNSPSTHRPDNDPAGDSRHRCESHLAQNQQHRSLSSPCDIGKPRFFMYFQNHLGPLSNVAKKSVKDCQHGGIWK